MLSVQSGERRERDEEEGQRGEARTVGGCMWVGGLVWVMIGV